MTAHKLDLDGTWDFQYVPQHNTDATPPAEWRSVLIPCPWQAQFDDLCNTSGTAFYRRPFTVVDHPIYRAAILHFGALDYHATVWLNEEPIGEHEGGYLPFEFDLTDALHVSENELTVKVVDQTDDRDAYPGFPFSEIPHGKQSWYGPRGKNHAISFGQGTAGTPYAASLRTTLAQFYDL